MRREMSVSRSVSRPSRRKKLPPLRPVRGERSEPSSREETRFLFRGGTDRLPPNRRRLSNAPGGAMPDAPPANPLFADTEPVDELLVPHRVLGLEVIEQAPTLAYQFQEPAPGVMVLLVGLEVLRQVEDPLGEERDLYLGRTRVAVVRAVS